MRGAEFERLYETQASSLLNFLYYRTGDRPLAEDLLADTFERVLRSRHRFRARRGTEKTWLYAIALNVLRDHLRRVAIGQRVAEQVATGVAVGGRDEIEASEERDALQRALETLSLEERETIALRYGADLTVTEIAQVTGEKASTIHGRVYRSLQKLREELS
jgi:RNA polymerase sigma factor (sigma-70 family)